MTRDTAILLVDDDSRFLSNTANLLERKGYRVASASNGTEALDLLERIYVQVVILDVKIPGLDGIATLREIKRRFPLIEVILLTGRGSIDSAVQGVKLGASDYLVKPAEVDHISEKIEDALDRRKVFRTQMDIRQKRFRDLKIRLAIGLLVAFTLPYVAFFAYFQYQFADTLKSSGRASLEALATSQKNTIDLFLQERVFNIFNLFQDRDFQSPPTQERMDGYLQRLRQQNDSFTDVGFLNGDGIQTGYAGLFPDLLGKDYSDEEWFQVLMSQDRDFFISDVYLGFRNKPHFTIAVRQSFEDGTRIFRSTLDPDKFYMFLRTMGRGKSGESIIINREGRFQLVDPEKGELLEVSDYVPAIEESSGVQEIERDGERFLVGHAWLLEAPWALVVRQAFSVAHEEMYKSRRVMVLILVILFFTIATCIWFANSILIDRFKESAETSEELRMQLFHASKLASVGELATGVAHEINNPLAVIIAASGVIRDIFNPDLGVKPTPEAVLQEVENIDFAVFRARTITRQLLDYGRKNEPTLEPCNVNQILDEVIDGLKQREFEVEGISIVRNYDPGMPDILLDRDKTRQVFLNLINNAGDVMPDGGTLTIATSRKRDTVRVSIQDTGAGISAEIMDQIFNPFFTTKEVGKGTGLGLSVSLNIVETLGGSIEVQSIEGAGSVFTVIFPIQREA
ncbi:MAG: response regulator [Thermoanaerobaculales bacterium]|nr:response regulator [Thermoanaerobaculales bacterium]